MDASVVLDEEQEANADDAEVPVEQDLVEHWFQDPMVSWLYYFFGFWIFSFNFMATRFKSPSGNQMLWQSCLFHPQSGLTWIGLLFAIAYRLLKVWHLMQTPKCWCP